MNTDHDFSSQNSAHDAPVAQSVREVSRSGIVDGASAVPEQHEQQPQYSRLETSTAAMTAYPEFPFRWLYKVRIAFMMVSLGLSVWGIYNIVEFIAKYGFKYWGTIVPASALLVYYGLQVLAGIFYLRSKALGFILSINIIGLFLQALKITTLIDVITHMDKFFQYANGLMYLNWALYFIDVALCIVFIFVTVREYSRLKKDNTMWTQGA